MFPQDVPESDVDRRGGGRDDRAPFEILTAVQRLMDVFDLSRILPDQEFAKMVNGSPQCSFPSRSSSLSQAMDAGIGLDLHDEPAAYPYLESKPLDVGDLHDANAPLIS